MVESYLNIPLSCRYEHAPGHPADWEVATVELVRLDGAAAPECADSPDIQETNLPAGQTSQATHSHSGG